MQSSPGIPRKLTIYNIAQRSFSGMFRQKEITTI